MIGTKLGDRYEVVGELGRGGMGVVYRARDPLLERDVAIKLVSPTQLTPAVTERLRREAKIVGRMDHPLIVSVYDMGEHEGGLFFVMPVVKGTSLGKLIKQGDLRLSDAVAIGSQVAQALSYSHSQGVLHRDIKPGNVMVARDPTGHLEVRVMDFGLARGEDDIRLTRSGDLIGTIAYLSPEQVSGERVTEASDIYALGVVLYECIAGRPPFKGEVNATLHSIEYEAPRSLIALGLDIPEDLDQFILRCLAKDHRTRPKDAGEIMKTLVGISHRLEERPEMDTALLETRSYANQVLDVPLVGRVREFGELQRRLEAAIDGSECQFVALSGDYGVGKTRLLQEFENLVRSREVRILHGRFAEQDRRFPYHGFCELVLDYFLRKETASSTTSATDFSDLAPDLLAIFPSLKEVATLRIAAESDTDGGARAASEDKAFVFELLARTLVRLSGDRPLVLVLEDIHLGEAAIEAMEYVIRRLGPTPTLVIGTFTPTAIDKHHPVYRLVESFRGHRHFDHLHLRNLAESDHRTLLKRLLGGGELERELVDQIYESTEGNPLFTKELVQSLVEAEVLVRNESDSWSLTSDRGISWHDLPHTVQQAVERRVEGLPENLSRVLAVAAVLGRSFDFRELEMLVDDTETVEASVDQLVERGLLEEARGSREDRLAFVGGIIRDVIYASLTRRRRRTLHRRCAESLEARYRNRVERVAPSLLHHWANADVADRVVHYGLMVARASLEAFSPRESIDAAHLVLEFLDDERFDGDRGLEGEARALLAHAHHIDGDAGRALTAARDAASVFQREDRHVDAARVVLRAARCAWEARRTAEATRWVETGIDLAEGIDEPDLLHDLLRLGATLANLRGDWQLGETYADRAESCDDTAIESQVDGGRLSVGFTHSFEGHEPALIVVNDEREILANVFETLITTDHHGHLKPLLCEGWESRNQGRTWVVKLRPGVRFHDGTPLDSEAAKRSFVRAAGLAELGAAAPFQEIVGAPNSGSGAGDDSRAVGFPDIPGIVVDNALTLHFELKRPLPIFPVLLTHPSTAIGRILPEGVRRAAERHGTGPFKLAEIGDNRTVLQRNLDWWGGDPPHVEYVEFRHGVSSAAMAEGLDHGTLDLARDLAPGDRDRILRDPRFRRRVVESSKKNTYFILFNPKGALGRLAAVRRALIEVLYTNDLVWRTLGYFAQPAVGIIPPGILGHDPGRRLRHLTSGEARHVLEQAGVSGSLKLRASIGPAFRDQYAPLMEAVYATWRELGIEVENVTTDLLSFLDSYENNDGMDILVGRWNADYTDPDGFTYGLFHANAGVFRYWVRDREIDLLCEQARLERRDASRASLYRRIERMLADRGLVIPLFHDVDYRIASPRVRRLHLDATEPYVNYKDLQLVEGPTDSDESPSSADERLDVLHMPTMWSLSTLDPVSTRTKLGAEIVPSIHETLYRVIEGARAGPWLAEDALPDATATTWRIRLRRNVRFHDGRRLTARDVRWSFERLLQKDGPQTRMLASIQGADDLMRGATNELRGFNILAAHEFEVRLEAPTSIFPLLLIHPTTAIVPEGSDPSKDPSVPGTGPFRVGHFEPGVRLDLEAFSDYWRPGLPRAGGITWHFNQAPEDVYREFRAGRFSIAAGLLPADVERLRRDSDLGGGYREAPGLATAYVQFNCRSGPLADRALRRALVAEIDVDQLGKRAFPKHCVPATGLVPPDLLGPTSTPRSSRHRRTQSAPNLQGLRLTAAVLPSKSQAFDAVTEEIRAQVRRAGVTITIVTETLADYVELVENGATDLIIGRWSAEYPDADSYVNGLYHSRTGVHHHYYASERIDALIAEARRESDPDQRRAIYRQFEQIVSRESILLPLFWEQHYRFVRPDIAGLDLRLSAPLVPYEALHRA